MTTHEIGSERKYVVGDAIEVLEDYQDEASLIYLDDAWARPKRAGQFGVEYSTHPFDHEQNTIDNWDDAVDTSISTTEILEKCYEALSDGGWLIADADDWLLPRLINYIQDEWGDVAESYEGGGYRKVGGVTYVSADGTPDRSTAGMYLSTGGYPVVFAHKNESDRTTSASARQIAPTQRENYGWGSVKPVKPYQKWVEGLLEPDDLVIVPCAGTAPAALAAERAFGDDARYVCIDNQEGAYEAFERRREEVIEGTRQQCLE